MSPDSVCDWLRSALPAHARECNRCRVVVLNNLHVNFLNSGFCCSAYVDSHYCETFISKNMLSSAKYCHCMVFLQFRVCRQKPDILGGGPPSLLSDNLSWFLNEDCHYHALLSELPSSVLKVTASCLCTPIKKIDRNKSGYISIIVRHFLQTCSEWAALSETDFWSRSASTVLPYGVAHCCVTVLSSLFINIYGEAVACKLRAHCFTADDFSLGYNAVACNMDISWLRISFEDMQKKVHRISKKDLKACIQGIPSAIQPLYNKSSFRKSCDCVLIHVLEYINILCNFSDLDFYSYVLSLLPALSMEEYNLPHHELLTKILNIVYGPAIVDLLCSPVVTTAELIKE